MCACVASTALPPTNPIPRRSTTALPAGVQGHGVRGGCAHRCPCLPQPRSWQSPSLPVQPGQHRVRVPVRVPVRVHLVQLPLLLVPRHCPRLMIPRHPRQMLLPLQVQHWVEKVGLAGSGGTTNGQGGAGRWQAGDTPDATTFCSHRRTRARYTPFLPRPPYKNSLFPLVCVFE